MSVQNKKSREIAPTRPGEMLREDFIPDCDPTTSGLAQKLGVYRQTVHEMEIEKIRPLRAA